MKRKHRIHEIEWNKYIERLLLCLYVNRACISSLYNNLTGEFDRKSQPHNIKRDVVSETTSEPFLPTTVTNEDENNANTSSFSSSTTQNTISTTIDPLKVVPLEHLNNSKTESPRDINVTIEANTQEISSTITEESSSSSSPTTRVDENVEAVSNPTTTTTMSTTTTAIPSKSNSTFIKLDEIENKMESKKLDDEKDNKKTTKETDTSTEAITTAHTQQNENVDVTTEIIITTTSTDKSNKIEFSNNMQTTTTTKPISENQDIEIDEVVSTTLMPGGEDEIKVTTISMNDETESPVEVIQTNNDNKEAKEGRAIDLSILEVKPLSHNNNETIVKEQSTEKMLEAIKLSSSTENANTSTNYNNTENIPITTPTESTTTAKHDESTVDSSSTLTHNENFDDEHSSRSHHDTENQQDIISDDICTKSGILYKCSISIRIHEPYSLIQILKKK
uniref:CSON010703 protein n=1 Tax=Culicoides sonorensis TaxID=179676 RepID=A0A336LQ49_CULSO